MSPEKKSNGFAVNVQVSAARRDRTRHHLRVMAGTIQSQLDLENQIDIDEAIIELHLTGELAREMVESLLDGARRI